MVSRFKEALNSGNFVIMTAEIIQRPAKGIYKKRPAITWAFIKTHETGRRVMKNQDAPKANSLFLFFNFIVRIIKVVMKTAEDMTTVGDNRYLYK